jgi:hypothetical protein
MNKILAALLAILFTQTLTAQELGSSADLMRSGLKIYVVVAVLVTIFAGIVIFLLSLERKVRKLEGRE